MREELPCKKREQYEKCWRVMQMGEREIYANVFSPAGQSASSSLHSPEALRILHLFADAQSSLYGPASSPVLSPVLVS